MTTKRRRKLDQYLRGVREDPEVVIQEMAQLSNRLFRLGVGLLVTVAMALLVIWTSESRIGWPAGVGVGALLIVANGLAWLAAVRVQPSAFHRPSGFNQMILLLALTVGLSWIGFAMGWSPFLAPVPLLAMVLAITFGQPVAFLLVASISFYLGFLSPRALTGGGLSMDVQLTVSQALGGMVAVLGMAHVRQQSRPFMVGLYAGLVQGAVVLAFELMNVKGGEQLQHADFRSLQSVRQLLQDPYWALVGGLISGAAVTCFLPALERFFGVVTERRLLAFHDPSNQLLTVLRTQAPGTHTHSLRVA